ncbi:MAG: ABC transporter ATP-binding protein [Acidimicrobiales bacterium]
MTTEASSASSSSPGWVRRLWPYVARHRGHALLAVLGAVGATVATVATPLVIRAVFDQAVLGPHPGRLVPLLALLVACGLVRFVAAYLRRWHGGQVALAVQHDLRTAIYDHLQRLDFARHDEMTTGQLVSRATSDVALVQGLLAMMPLTLGNIASVAASAVAMVILSPPLAVVTLAALPAVVVGALRLRSTLFPATWDAQQRAARVAGVVDEAVEGVRVVKGFGQEDREVARLAGAAEALYSSRVRAARIQARFEAGLGAVPALSQVGILAVGGMLAARGSLSLGTLVAFTTYLAQLVSPTRFAALTLAMASQARAGVERIGDLLDSAPVVGERPDAATLTPLAGEVVLDGVSFGYLRTEPVLSGFDLRIEPGETVALVGGSGSGKSTVALLLPRFYDVQEGSVRLDGVDVRDVTLDSLRRQIGVVFEDPFLFSDSVRSNIAYGRPEATYEEVEAAARAAEAHAFVTDLPNGYATVIGERGVTLSGGQRQRLALARALLTNPRLLVLDDATSAVDANVEEEIHATLRRLLVGRTTLLVAHRRSTLRLANRIAVVDGGRVLDTGTHTELWGRCPRYRQLLAGPGDRVEGDGVEDAAGATEPDDTVVTPTTPGPGPAWRRAPTAAGSNATLAVDLSGAGHRPQPGRAGAHLGHASTLAALAPTPDLLAALEHLPPATERPGVDVAAASAADPRFTLGRILAPHRLVLMAAVALVLVHAGAGLAGPALVRRGIDHGVAAGSVSVVIAAAGILGLVSLADWLVTWGGSIVTSRLAERVLFGLRVRVFAHLQRLGIDFYERETAGEIMTRMTGDMEALSSLLEEGMVNAVSNLVVCAGVTVALVMMDPLLAGVALAVIPPLVGATAWFRRRSDRAYQRARVRVAAVNTSLQEGLAGVRVSQAFGQEDRHRRQFRAVAGEFLDARLEAQHLLALYFPFVELLSVVAAAMVLGVGAGLVSAGTLTAGELIAFSLYLTLFFSPIQQLSQVVDAYQQARVALRQMAELLAVPPAVADSPRARDPGRVRGEIRFEDVHFRYPGARIEALRGVDLSISAGETIALVGETGAGKSTMVKLLARFCDPTSGRVLVDGQPLTDVSLAAYRRQLGYVPQEPFLQAASVRDVIAFARPDATDADVEAAARAVGAHEVVAGLTGGYDHVLAERGRSLSGGERQLLALARARLADPAVLLLDEATANLDLATEARVNRALTQLVAGRTTVLVAHRLQTARRADRIVVMADGRVAEQGTHDDLVARGGAYARLWAAFDTVAAS